MFNLFILLLERVGLIIIIAYMLMNINHFKTMMGERKIAFSMAINNFVRSICYNFKFHWN